ncbi:MAG: hypothetical protein KatS3mg051_0095 [Anaerolineae bacterium]|nr:MAG: hypothetical protein KatS3mg051_0095 [Anaerolineae bacterium]
MTICDTLLQGLTHADPAVRLDVVRVIGMVEETQALDRLRALYPVESDEAVRRAMAWAGQRLHQARQAGYLTVDALCSHFGVDRAVEEMPDVTEAELMERFQQQLDRDLLASERAHGAAQGGHGRRHGCGRGVARRGQSGHDGDVRRVAAGRGRGLVIAGDARPGAARTGYQTV